MGRPRKNPLPVVIENISTPEAIASNDVIVEQYTPGRPVVINKELPFEPLVNTEYRDENTGKYYKFNGKRWVQYAMPLSSKNEPIEIIEKKGNIIEIFAANSWVILKQINSDTIELELSKLLDKHTISIKGKDIQVNLCKTEKTKKQKDSTSEED